MLILAYDLWQAKILGDFMFYSILLLNLQTEILKTITRKYWIFNVVCPKFRSVSILIEKNTVISTGTIYFHGVFVYMYHRCQLQVQWVVFIIFIKIFLSHTFVFTHFHAIWIYKKSYIKKHLRDRFVINMHSLHPRKSHQEWYCNF